MARIHKQGRFKNNKAVAERANENDRPQWLASLTAGSSALVLSVLFLLSIYWAPLKLSLALLLFALGGPLAQASRCSGRVSFTNAPPS